MLRLPMFRMSPLFTACTGQFLPAKYPAMDLSPAWETKIFSGLTRSTTSAREPEWSSSMWLQTM